MGKFVIAQRVISDIIKVTARNTKGVREVHKVISDNNTQSLTIGVVISANKGINLVEVVRRLQEKSLKMIEEMTAFNVEAFNIDIRSLV